MRIVYVPLEAYESRYTLQLREWTLREFKRLNVNNIVIEGTSLSDDKQIKTGAVLDAHQRSFFALSQIQTLVKMLYENKLTADDFIFFEDMFHPGIESLFYVIDQQFKSKHYIKRPKIGMRCLAQTLDPDDFVYYTDMAKWMRHYESMVNEKVNLIFMNSQEMLGYATVAGWNVPCVVTGNAFGKKEVIERLGTSVKDFELRSRRVVFASRIANEKQPEFFLEVAEAVKVFDPNIEFAILSGGRISNPLIDRAVIKGHISVYPNLTKEKYYAMLNDSRVAFMSSLQDWVSVVMPEADTLGCNILAPAYRAFPEAMFNSCLDMYIPWSLDDAITKVLRQVDRKSPLAGKFSDYQNKSIERTVSAITSFMSDSLFSEVYPQNTSYRKEIIEKAIARKDLV